MIFEVINLSRLKASLDIFELVKLGIHYEDIGKDRLKTAELIDEVLKRASEEKSFSIGGAKLFVEAFTDEDGGLTLYITDLSGKGRIKRIPQKKSIVCRLGSMENMITACRALFEQHTPYSYKSTLLYDSGRYLLVVSAGEQGAALIRRILCEFGELMEEDNIFLSYINEHAQRIVEDNAIETIAYYLF